MFSRCYASVWAVGALLTVLTAAAGRCGGISPATRQADPRLEKLVTISAPRIYVGELLDRLSEQTGVTLVADDRDGTADGQVAVFLSAVPLADAMDALWSLLSYQDAEWLWSRSKKGFRYWLERPPAAQQMAARLSQQVQASLEDEAKAMLGALKLTPEQLQQAARHDPRLTYLIESPRGRSGLTTFAETLSPERQLAVLRGQERARVPVSELSPQSRAFVHSVWVSAHAIQKEGDGPWRPVPEPPWIEFRVQRPGTAMSPDLYIHMEGIGGYAYLGGTPLDRTWRERLAGLWTLPGDATVDQSARTAGDRTSQNRDSHTAPIRGVMARRSQQIARALSSVLKASPMQAQSDRSAPDGGFLPAFLARLQGQMAGMQEKRRDGILLIAHPGWFNEEVDGSTVPWAVVKKLRQTEDAEGGTLSLRDLATTADLLTEPQLLRLANEEFPVMVQVARRRALFVLMNRSPVLATRLLSPAGVPISELPPDVRLLMGIQPLLDRGEAAYLRVLEKEAAPTTSPFAQAQLKAEGQKPFTRAVTIEVIAPDGRVLTSQGFSYGGRNTD